LSASSFVVVYNDGFYTNDDGKAIIGNINNGVISFSNEYVFCTDFAAYFRVPNLDTNSFVVTYHEWSSSGGGTACIGTINGNVISFGDKYIFSQVMNLFSHPLRLDAEHFLISSNNPSDTIVNGYSYIGTVIGDSILYSPPYMFNQGYSANISTALLDENKFVVAFGDLENSYYGTAVIGTLYDIETIIDSMDVCAGSFGVPVRVNHLYNVSESLIQINYDTSLISYIGYENFSSNILTDSLSINENEGVINVYWHTDTAVNLPADTLVELLFCSVNNYTQTGTILSFNDTISYYLDSTGVALEADYFSGLIEIDPIPEPAVFIYGTDSVCQGASNVIFSIDFISNADSIIWNLTPDTAGSVIGNDTNIYINFSPSFYGSVVLSAYGVNVCGNGDTAFYNIVVIGYPSADAGPDSIICENTSHQLSGLALNYSITEWSTTGDGNFNNPYLLDAEYSPGPNDNTIGNVNLILSATAINPCTINSADTMLLGITKLPFKPQIPVGPTIINIEPGLTSEYYTGAVENADDYQWFLIPVESGDISGNDTVAIVNWNEDFTGISANINVEAINECGVTTSDTLTINISPVKLNKTSWYNYQISISPNPSDGIFNIEFVSMAEKVDLTVINSKGIKIKEYKINLSGLENSFQLDMHDQSSGIYYLQFSGSVTEVVKKVVVKHIY